MVWHGVACWCCSSLLGGGSPQTFSCYGNLAPSGPSRFTTYHICQLCMPSSHAPWAVMPLPPLGPSRFSCDLFCDLSCDLSCDFFCNRSSTLLSILTLLRQPQQLTRPQQELPTRILAVRVLSCHQSSTYATVNVYYTSSNVINPRPEPGADSSSSQALQPPREPQRQSAAIVIPTPSR